MQVETMNTLESELTPVKKPPKVSVCIITYNQEKYIRKCLESVLTQDTDFSYEIIIGDDCSKDGTTEIVRDFEKQYPDIVKPIFHKKNVGGMNNYLAVHRAAKGDYVCHVDGDDWLRPNKLNIQKKFLDNNKQYALSAHRVGVWKNETQIDITKAHVREIDLPRLLRGHPMFVHSSIMYRRDRFSRFFESDRVFIDFYLYILATTRGGIGFINEVLGDYRANVGVSSARNLMPYIQEAISFAAEIIGNTSDVRRSRARAYLSYAVASLLDQDVHIFRNYLSDCIKSDKKWLMPRFVACLALNPKLLRLIVQAYKKAKIAV